MPLVWPEDCGTTGRKHMGERRALAIWEAHRGHCVLCRLPIDGVRADWIVEHIRPLGLAGEETAENTGPAHLACAEAKTYGDSGDLAQINEAKDRKAAHIGIKPTGGGGFQRKDPQRRASAPLEKQLPPRRSLYAGGQ